MAMAMSNFWVPYGKSLAAGLNVATWDGTFAIGANIGGQVSDGLHFTGGIAISESGLVARSRGNRRLLVRAIWFD